MDLWESTSKGGETSLGTPIANIVIRDGDEMRRGKDVIKKDIVKNDRVYNSENHITDREV